MGNNHNKLESSRENSKAVLSGLQVTIPSLIRALSSFFSLDSRFEPPISLFSFASISRLSPIGHLSSSFFPPANPTKIFLSLVSENLTMPLKTQLCMRIFLSAKFRKSQKCSISFICTDFLVAWIRVFLGFLRGSHYTMKMY